MLDFDKIVKDILAKFEGVQAIYLFGSYADGTNKKGSDCDIAILAEKKFDTLQFWRFSNDLASSHRIDFDLIELLKVPDVFRFEIVTTAKLLYVKDQEFLENFEALVFKKYLRLNEERREIIENFI